jgi:hypothetical protein
VALQRLWVPASIGLVLAMACAASAWRDCMLLAVSLVLAYRLRLLQMDRGPSWRAFEDVVSMLSAGVLAVGAGVALVAGIGAAWAGWWHPTAAHPAMLQAMLIFGAAWCCLSATSRRRAGGELRLWLCVLGGSLVAMEAWRSGWSMAPCFFVVVVGLTLVWAGRRLVIETTSTLMRDGGDSG